MLNDLQPYPEYKDSGLPWLGEIPKHWDVRRNGRLFAQRNETGFPDLPILEVSLKTGVRIRDFADSKRKQVMADRAKYKRGACGDIAYNMMRMWQGAVGVAPVDGLVSPAYVVAEPHAETEGRYYAYLFRTAAYMNEVNKYSHGIVTDRNRLYWDQFKQMPSAFPPPDEQVAIAHFLDQHGNYVRRFIRNKRRLIELLNEQKQVIVDRAVTRGIDSTVLFRQHKDAWVGEVPQHWRVSKIKRNTLFNPSKSETGLDRTSAKSAVFLPMEKVSASGVIDCSEIRSISELWDGYTYFRRDDVVVAKITPCFENGKGAYLGALSTDFGFGTTEFVVLRATRAILPRFLYFLTQTQSFRLRATEFMTGAAGQKRVPVDFIKNYPVALPPIEEQRVILQHIDQEMSRLDQAIARAKQQIELIRDYRTRLIADVVTGKLDVRRLAPEIIEPLPEDLEPLDDDDNFSEEESGAPEDFELAEEVAVGDD